MGPGDAEPVGVDLVELDEVAGGTPRGGPLESPASPDDSRAEDEDGGDDDDSDEGAPGLYDDGMDAEGSFRGSKVTRGHWARVSLKARATHTVVQRLVSKRQLVGDLSAAVVAHMTGRGPERWFNRSVPFHPDSTFRRSWDVLQIVALAYIAVMVPVRIGFDAPAYGHVLRIEACIDVYFVLDVVLNFLTAEWKEVDLERVLITSYQSVASTYARSWLAIDLIACFPINYITMSEDGDLECSFSLDGCTDGAGGQSGSAAFKAFKLLRIVRLAKLLRLARVQRLLARYQDELVYWARTVVLAKTCVMLLGCGHWLGCLFGAIYPDFEDGASLEDKYVSSTYWAVQTVTTVGYGDMSTDDTSTQVVAIVCMMVGSFLFSWLLTNMIAAMNPDSVERRTADQLGQIMTFLRNNKVPADTSRRILSHFRRTHRHRFDDAKLVGALPQALRGELFDQLYYSKVEVVHLWSSFGEDIILHICMRMVPLTLPAGQMVYVKGEMADKDGSMYVITRGCVELRARPMQKMARRPTIPTETKLITTLNATGVFGEGSAIGVVTRMEDALARSGTALLGLNRREMAELFVLEPKLHGRIVRHCLEHTARLYDADSLRQVCKDLGCTHVMRPDAAELHADWEERLSAQPVATAPKVVRAPADELQTSGEPQSGRKRVGAQRSERTALSDEFASASSKGGATPAGSGRQRRMSAGMAGVEAELESLRTQVAAERTENQELASEVRALRAAVERLVAAQEEGFEVSECIGGGGALLLSNAASGARAQ